MASTSATVPPPRQNRGIGYDAWAISLFSAATVMIAMRMYVRISKRSLGWDDFWMFCAWGTALFQMITIILDVKAGMGQHQYYVMDNLSEILKQLTLTQLAAAWLICFVKLSIIAFVLRLVGKASNGKYIRWTCYVNLALFLPITIATFIILVVQCIPLKALWESDLPKDRCLSRTVVGDVVIALASSSAVTDILTSVLPILVLVNLQISRKRKWGLCFLMALGLLISGIAIAKAVAAATAFASDDITYGQFPLADYFIIEAYGGMCIACLPAIASLLHDWSDRAASQVYSLRQVFSTSDKASRTSSTTAVSESKRSISNYEKKMSEAHIRSSSRSGTLSNSSTQDEISRPSDIEHGIVQTLEVDISHHDADSPTVIRHGTSMVEAGMSRDKVCPFPEPSRQ